MDGQLSYTPHPNPPRMEEDQLDRLRLIRSKRVGPITFHRLMEDYGTAKAALKALPQIAAAAGEEGYLPHSTAAALAEMTTARKAGARPIFYGASGYPEALAQLPDAPPILWAMGDQRLLDRPLIAIAGARTASSLGLRMVRHLAEGLSAAGYVVVSGLARGIDAQAHYSALQGGTIAVQAGGVDVIYPEENADLALQIAQKGLRISEQIIGLRPMARHFPMRNRIISGLCQAVIVVEAAARSGSLITARLALEQGREVMAVPGHPFDPRSGGCNMLLRDGALLVRGVEDVLSALGHVTPSAPLAPPKERLRPPPVDMSQMILSRLSCVPMSEDQLIRSLDLPVENLMSELLTLEMQGVILRHSGGLLSKVS